MTDLTGCILKLNRANAHLYEIMREVSAFLSTNPYRAMPDPLEPVRGEHTWCLEEDVPDPPEVLGVLIGDCVHNLVSALDHLVCLLSELGGETDCDSTM